MLYTVLIILCVFSTTINYISKKSKVLYIISIILDALLFSIAVYSFITNGFDFSLIMYAIFGLIGITVSFVSISKK